MIQTVYYYNKGGRKCDMLEESCPNKIENKIVSIKMNGLNSIVEFKHYN